MQIIEKKNQEDAAEKEQKAYGLLWFLLYCDILVKK